MTAPSAFNPPPADQAEGRSGEPSMEDILASIRRIIADDQGGKAAQGGSARRAAPDDDRAARIRNPYDDVLDLARLVPSADAGPGPAAPPEPTPRVSAAEAVPDEEDAYDDALTGLRARMAEPAAGRAGRERAADHGLPALSHDDDLLSAPLGESVMSAFETLAATVVLQNKPMLENVLRDVLRPLVKSWLDDNLPGLVERLVRTEIERVARGGRA